MALKLFPIPFPVFAPPLQPNPNPNATKRPSTEIRFARWNNANAEKFNQRQRAQQEIEDDIRRHRRFTSATSIVTNYDPKATKNTSQRENSFFKSTGTPSSPSSPSIPGRKSKYSKQQKEIHPAFRPKISRRPLPQNNEKPAIDRKADIKLSEDGVSYVIDGAPFEFKYSYTEMPKVKPLKLREAPFAPFGPTTMQRPWTGRAPLPPSKKKLREFDSFALPPPGKKGVKSVQAPGPFLPGSGPRYVKIREEILGEPLTDKEIKELVDGCLKSKRQLNMGRDGLTHNMLDNINAHWKRRRVCKIKCKGVCTIDMDYVCQQLEEKTGGKIIYRKGGVLYLFRGRNYNYRFRPRFPLMLWKPVTPVYPRLIPRAPEGLTLQEASAMRSKGRKLIPICKLGKNGVYLNLLINVREAFEECELVRINCQGLNGSDYRKIGAKLRDLVPCVLISFEQEHILMWRGRDWKFSLTKPEDDCEKDYEEQGEHLVKNDIHETESADVSGSTKTEICESATTPDNAGSSAVIRSEIMSNVNASEVMLNRTGSADDTLPTTSMESNTTLARIGNIEEFEDVSEGSQDFSEPLKLGNAGYADDTLTTISLGYDPTPVSTGSMEEVEDVSEGSQDFNEPAKLSVSYTEGVLQLLKQAVDTGRAHALDDTNLDADMVYQKAVEFSQSASPGPVFRHRTRKAVVWKSEMKENGDLEVKEVPAVSKIRDSEKSSKVRRRRDFNEEYVDSVPQGTLRVDELVKLLA